jgi:hypothetical protein
LPKLFPKKLFGCAFYCGSAGSINEDFWLFFYYSRRLIRSLVSCIFIFIFDSITSRQEEVADQAS